LTVLFALQDYTKFCYYPASHLKTWQEMDRDAVPVEIILMRGEYVIFDPLLVHYGGAYPYDNCRIHFYLLSPKCGLATEVDVDGVHPLTEARPQNSGFRKDHVDMRRQSQLKKRNLRSERGINFYLSMNEAKKIKRARQTRLVS